MAKFMHARLTIAFIEDGLEGAKQQYDIYFTKKSLVRWKSAVDALLERDEDLKSLVSK